MLLYTHPACLEHDPGPGHPECPARLEAVLHAVRTAFPGLPWRQAPEATRDMLLRVHTRELVASVLAISRSILASCSGVMSSPLVSGSRMGHTCVSQGG